VTVTINQVLCSGIPVSDVDQQVGATFVLVTEGVCKQYNLDAVQNESSFVLFQPQGEGQVDYRGTIAFGPKALVLSDGALQLLLEYDPTGGDNFSPVPPCDNVQVDEQGVVVSADVPAPDTWCFATVTSTMIGTSDASTIWQVWGHDDPKFH
jgi:hypothetical protein